MSLRVCLDCTTAFAVGVQRCPHCGSERHAEQGSAAALGIQASVPVEVEDSMPKITRHGGASVASEAAEIEGGEDVSAGASTSTSSETPSKKPEPSEKPDRSPARTTGNRSGKARTAKGSTARTTDGGPEAGTSATGSADQ
ncbi:hypothetical protein CFC35_05770 [Streptomyces sp. FBKL.4005]|nr:hypothetical protein CFC35_05770 [Streptomyces sp. FBKL.4005]